MQQKVTKFVHLEWRNDYEKYVLLKSEKTPNVYLNNTPDKRRRGIIWFLYKAHMSPRLNCFFSLPFKSIWNSYMLESRIKKSLSRDDRVVFIFSGFAYEYIKNNLIRYLRKKYPSCCVIYMFSDKAELYQKIDSDFSVDILKLEFDSVMSYNERDVEKYSLLKSPTRIHDFSDVENDGSIPCTDIFFAGMAKDRFDDIIRVFEKAEAQNLKCDFTVIGVPEEKRVYKDRIEYEKRLPYEEMLKRVKRSKCILNIVQDGADGITLRDYEAVGMNKLLITNSKAIEKLPCYNESMVIKLGKLDTELEKLINFDENASWKQSEKSTYSDYYEKLEQLLFGRN